MIREIGFTMVELDNNPRHYLGRSFCILEVLATVVGGARMGMVINLARAFDIEAELCRCPVKSAEAMTWATEDKELIDGFIRERVGGGFEGLDQLVTKSIIQGAADALAAARQKTVLDFSGWDLSSSGDAKIIAQIVREWPSLLTLNLSSVDLGAAGVLDLIESIRECQHLVTLALDGRPLAVKQLRGTEPAASIDLAAKGLKTASAIVIASLIASNTVITELNLESNQIGADGAEHLARALVQNSKLTRLNVRNNDLDGVAARLLRHAAVQTERADFELLIEDDDSQQLDSDDPEAWDEYQGHVFKVNGPRFRLPRRLGKDSTEREHLDALQSRWLRDAILDGYKLVHRPLPGGYNRPRCPPPPQSDPPLEMNQLTRKSTF